MAVLRFVLFLIVNLSIVAGSGVFELQLTKFVNGLGRNAERNCCRGTWLGETNKCSESCRTMFRVCLKHYQTSIDLSGPCTYGDFMTPVLGDNSFDFNATDKGFVRLPFEFSWPVSPDLSHRLTLSH